MLKSDEREELRQAVEWLGSFAGAFQDSERERENVAIVACILGRLVLRITDTNEKGDDR